MKPPIGLMPRHIWIMKRAFEITEAIDRYMDASNPVPIEWVEEYNGLIKQIAEEGAK